MNVTDVISQNFSISKTVKCDMMNLSVAHKVDTTFKILILVLPALMCFKWWAIIKIIDSSENMERKKFLISFAELFINGVSLLLFFYLIYFVFIAQLQY
jgi:hypothetical protein